MDTSREYINAKLDALSRSAFRAKFHLGPREREMLRTKGLDMIRQHAADLIAKRLAPAEPKNDGKQTPFRGHPVFIAQHATGTCCRTCLLQWHKLAPGQELTGPEQDYVVEVLISWMSKEQEKGGQPGR